MWWTQQQTHNWVEVCKLGMCFHLHSYDLLPLARQVQSTDKPWQCCPHGTALTLCRQTLKEAYGFFGKVQNSKLVSGCSRDCFTNGFWNNVCVYIYTYLGGEIMISCSSLKPTHWQLEDLPKNAMYQKRGISALLIQKQHLQDWVHWYGCECK